MAPFALAIDEPVACSLPQLRAANDPASCTAAWGRR